MEPLLRGGALLSGCRTCYLDFGSNRGGRIQLLYAPLYGSWGQQGVYKTWFQNVSRETVCAVGFEPNPVHWPRLERIERKLRGDGRRVHIFPAAIWDNNSVATFWSDAQASRNFVGSSLLRWHGSMRANLTYRVPTVSLAWFLNRHVPSDSRVYSKMDIEGAEFDALPPAVPALCRSVDVLQLEVHQQLLKHAKQRYKLPIGEGWDERRRNLSRVLRDVQCRRSGWLCVKRQGQRPRARAGENNGGPPPSAWQSTCRTDVPMLWTSDRGT